MYRSGSGLVQDTLRALAQEGSLAYPTSPGAVGVDEVDADTVDRVQEEMRGVRAEGGKVRADMHSGAAASRKDAESVGHGYYSTCSRHLLLVAVREQWSLCLDAR